MRDQPSQTVIASDGRRVVFPLLAETLVRSRMADASGERLELRSRNPGGRPWTRNGSYSATIVSTIPLGC
jgi:hypothetical protein